MLLHLLIAGWERAGIADTQERNATPQGFNAAVLYVSQFGASPSMYVHIHCELPIPRLLPAQ